jgi:hypothetical protein
LTIDRKLPAKLYVVGQIRRNSEVINPINIKNDLLGWDAVQFEKAQLLGGTHRPHLQDRKVSQTSKRGDLRLEAVRSACYLCLDGLLFGLLFHSEYGGDMFFLNVMLF